MTTELFRTSDKDSIERQTAEIRAMCEFILSVVDALDRCEALEKEKVRKDIAMIRLCITTMKKHYPKAPEIWKEMTSIDIPDIVSRIQAAQNKRGHEPTEYIQQLKDWLEFPERYKTNYVDMYVPQFMPWEKWFANWLLEQQSGHEEDPYFGGVDIDEKLIKKLRRHYEKDKEAFDNERK